MIVRVRDAVGLAGAHVGQVARKEQQPRPIETDLEPAAQGRQLEEINAAPDEPGQEARQMEPEKVGHRGVAADGTKFAQLLERERGGSAARAAREEYSARTGGLAVRRTARWWAKAAPSPR